jgi:hypothetical protein
MLYLMLIYQDDARMAAASPEEQQAIGQGYGELNGYLATSGVSRGTATWPANITTLRTVAGAAQVTDEAHASGGQSLAGFFLIDVPDRDAAVEVAKRVPGTQFGAVEIRPVQE